MSDEEKKAMFQLKDLENDKEHLIIEQRQSITTILNLIEKQQKEIEELKEKNKTTKQMNKNLLEVLKDSISKDKIKAKIEELEKGNKNTFIRGEKILVLQSLLEKE